MEFYNWGYAALYDRTKGAVLGAILFVAFTFVAYALMPWHTLDASRLGFIGDPAFSVAFHNDRDDPVKVTVLARSGVNELVLGTYDVAKGATATDSQLREPPATVVFRVESLASGSVISESIIKPTDGWYEMEIK